MSKENLQLENAALGPESLSKTPSQNITIGSAAINHQNPLGLQIGDRVKLHVSRQLFRDDNGCMYTTLYDFGEMREYSIIGSRTIFVTSRESDNTLLAHTQIILYECKRYMTCDVVHLALPEDIDLIFKAVEWEEECSSTWTSS